MPTARTPVSGGTAAITGIVNHCPTLQSLLGRANSAPVGGSVSLQVFGSDSDQRPAPLSYMWLTSAGRLRAPSSASTALDCTALGPVIVSVWLTDGDPHCAPLHASLSIDCIPGRADVDADPAVDTDAGA